MALAGAVLLPTADGDYQQYMIVGGSEQASPASMVPMPLEIKEALPPVVAGLGTRVEVDSSFFCLADFVSLSSGFRSWFSCCSVSGGVLMRRRPQRDTPLYSSEASDGDKRKGAHNLIFMGPYWMEKKINSRCPRCNCSLW